LSPILPSLKGDATQRAFNRSINGVRKGLGLRNAATIETVEITKNYDIFFYVAWSPQALVELSHIRNWRSRSKVTILYMFELWSSTLETNKSYLRLLDQFDFVFMLHSASIGQLGRYTSAHCSSLPAAVDTLIATAYPSPPKRVIYIYAMGNRSPLLHRTLINRARKRNLFYVYDSLFSSGSPVKDWAEHRLLLTNKIKRTRYFLTFNPADLPAQRPKAAEEQVVPARLFEGAAGGAIMLGTAPKCPEFETCFDWQDAGIEVSATGENIDEVLEELDGKGK